MKRTITKRLTLHRETIFNLSGVAGGKEESIPLSTCLPPTIVGTACMPDTTPNKGCMPSLEVPCEERVSNYC